MNDKNVNWKRKSEFFCSMDGRIKLYNFYGLFCFFRWALCGIIKISKGNRKLHISKRNRIKIL